MKEEFTIFGWTPKKIFIMILIGLSVWLFQKMRSGFFHSQYNIEEYFTNKKQGCTACGEKS